MTIVCPRHCVSNQYLQINCNNSISNMDMLRCSSMPKQQQQQKYQSIKLYHHLISKINQYIELERKKKI